MRKLSKYQQSINDIAAKITLDNPDLLSSKQKLWKEARKKLDESGYGYKKGKSRSKQLVSSSESDESTPAPKRIKTTEALRVKRISEIEEDLKDISQRMGFKEKRREQATLSHQYGICDQISEEISSLKDRRRALEKELHSLKKKEKQSKWYKNKGKSRSNSGSSSSSNSGSMKQVGSSESEGQQLLPPSSNSETSTSRSLTFSQAATDGAQHSNPSLADILNAVTDTPESPLLHQSPRIRFLPHLQAHTSSDSPSLADLISSAIDSDVCSLSPSVSLSPQTPQTCGSESLAELLNSAIAATSGALSVHEETEDSSVSQEKFEHFQ